MTDAPFRYSMDSNFKSRIEYFEEEHPLQELEGLTDDQIEALLREAGIGEDFDPDETMPSEATESPVSASNDKPKQTLTTSEMRIILVANGVPVGARGRLSPAQIAKAIELS